MPGLTGASNDSDQMGCIMEEHYLRQVINASKSGRISNSGFIDLADEKNLLPGETPEEREKALNELYDITQALQGRNSTRYDTQSSLYNVIKTTMGLSWASHPIGFTLTPGEKEYMEQIQFDREHEGNLQREDRAPGPPRGQDNSSEDNIFQEEKTTEKAQDNTAIAFDKAVDEGKIFITQSHGTKFTPGSYRSASFPFQKIDNPNNVEKYYKLNAAAPIAPLYKNFTGDFDEKLNPNCMKAILLAKYNVGLPVKKQIAKGTIEKISDTSIQDLKDFCDKYKISYKLFNMTGNQIAKAKYPANGRPKLVAMIANGHLYTYTGSSQKIRLEQISTLEPVKLAPGDEKVKVDKREISRLNPNFTYRAEDPLVCKALNFTGDSVSLAFENTFKVDLKRAYYNCFFKIYADRHIGVFTPNSLIEPFTDLTPLRPENEYFLSIVPKYFITNKLLGHTIIELLVQNRIKLTDIVYYKKADYTIPIKDIIAVYNKAGITDTKNFRQFSILSGNLATRVPKPKQITADIAYGLDIDLIEKYKEESASVRLGQRIISADLTAKKTAPFASYSKPAEYRWLNNSNIYDVIVDLCCLETIKTINVLETAGCTIESIKVDSIQYYSPTGVNLIAVSPKGDYSNPLIKYSPETPALCKKDSYNQEPYNIALIMGAVNDEREKVSYMFSMLNLPAGRGKTYYIRNNIKFDRVMTISNILAAKLTADLQISNSADKSQANPLLLGFSGKAATTIHRGLQIGQQDTVRIPSGALVWIDEFSLICKYIWSSIVCLAMQGVKFILSGDVNQTPPVGEPSVDATNIWSIISANQITMPEHNFARNDTRISELSVKILNSPVESWINTLEYISEDQCLEHSFHLTSLHKTRNRINNAIMAKRNLTINFEKQTVSAGIILEAISASSKLNLTKGQRFYTHESTDGKSVKMSVISDPNTLTDIESRPIQEVPWEKFIRKFEISFAMTAQGSQGLTILDNFCIHDPSRIYTWDKKILYTAVTRGKIYDNMHFCTVSKSTILPLKETDILDDYRIEKKIVKRNKMNNLAIAI